MVSSIGLYSGLGKAARESANEAFAFCIEMIIEDGKRVPDHERLWKIGHTFSWHYVKIVEYRTQQMIAYIEKGATMATKKKSKSNAFTDKYEFVRCELRAEDKKSAKIWIEENTAELGALLHDTVASDYKFSLSFSSEHDTFTACFTGKEDNPLNSFKTLTARHKDWTIAALTLLFKHSVLFKGGVWETDTDEEDDGWA